MKKVKVNYESHIFIDEHIDKFKEEIPRYMVKHQVRPGMTGWAQVNGRNFVDWDRRLQFDIEYVNKITFLGDVKIIWMTIVSVLKKSDVAEVTDDVEGNLAEIRAEKMKNA